jgi:hypothetical protein
MRVFDWLMEGLAYEIFRKNKTVASASLAGCQYVVAS